MDARRPDVVTIAITRADGGLTVMRLITAEYEPDGQGGRRMRWQRAPKRAYVEETIAKYGWTGDLAAVSWRIVPNDFIDESTDRTFRDAWKDTGKGKPDHDMPKAREIQRQRVREERAPLLEDLDVAYARADERGDQAEKKRIAQRKQTLRDAPADPRIESAQTVEELKALTLEVLGG